MTVAGGILGLFLIVVSGIAMFAGIGYATDQGRHSVRADADSKRKEREEGGKALLSGLLALGCSIIGAALIGALI